MLDEEKIHLLSDYINNSKVDEVAVKWNHYQDIQRQISYNLRYIFLHLELSHNTSDNTEISASTTFKSLLKKAKSIKQLTVDDVVIDCVPKYLQRHLYIDGNFQANRYELMLYQAINRQIEAGNIFIRESFNNRSLEADLIALDYWQSNKIQILEQIALPKLLKTPEAFLKKLETALETKIKQVNLDIAKGNNKSVNIKHKAEGKTNWQLNYPDNEKVINHEIYRQLPVNNIHSLLRWLNKRSDFLNAFTHVLPKNTQHKSPEVNSLIACIVALGTNHGLSDMSSRSDMEYNHLRRTYQNFMRQNTLSDANSVIVDATAKLSFFTHYNIQENTVHSSSDGQKYSTRFDTIKARYSTKYFGLGKGVSLQTLVLNHIPVNAKIIGANEHESHYVFDLLMNNQTKLRPDIHSTDSHGTNKVNFAILDCFGYRFAPRYKKFTVETENLVGFKSPSQYPKKYLIKPHRKIDKERFIKQWDSIQRIMASLALKTTSQSNIVRKLSSFKRVNNTQTALNDYNDIVKAIFMLDYTDSASFRKNIQKALNRGEGYHRLRKNVAYAHDGKMQAANTVEQQVWSECARLICNTIIYYNTYLLSELMGKSIRENKTEDVEIIKGISPIAWQHINLHGLYQFQTEAVNIDWETILARVKIKK